MLVGEIYLVISWQPCTIAYTGYIISLIILVSISDQLLFNFRHVGDLGNVLADENGTAPINITDKMLTLTGPLSIVGRSMVVRITGLRSEVKMLV